MGKESVIAAVLVAILLVGGGAYLLVANLYNTKPVRDFYGCTDPDATNYDISATVDDGSCTYPPIDVEGCMDSNATNYNANATVDDGSCEYQTPPPVEGCMDANATNFNSEATIDDGSCEYPPPENLSGCTDENATNYESQFTIEDGSCIYDSLYPGIIEFFMNKHRVVWNDSSDSSDYLYLFMPGSGQNATDDRTRWTTLSAADVGMRGITLSYQSQGMVATWCATENDSDCMEKVRMERIYGQDTSTLVDCNYSQSVVGLTVELLQDLDSTYPEMNWSRWLTDAGTPDWSKIVLGGHSQGGGNAALIARDFDVARVVMYGTPFDRDPTGDVDTVNQTYTPAPWILDAHVTPSERYFVFYHNRDHEDKYYILEGNLMILLNLTIDDAINVDNLQAPYTVDERFIFMAGDNNYGNHTVVLQLMFKEVHKHMIGTGF